MPAYNLLQLKYKCMVRPGLLSTYRTLLVSGWRIAASNRKKKARNATIAGLCHKKPMICFLDPENGKLLTSREWVEDNWR